MSNTEIKPLSGEDITDYAFTIADDRDVQMVFECGAMWANQHCEEYYKQELAKKDVEIERLKNPWISVRERLPQESCMVLIFTKAGGVYVSHYKKRLNLFTAYGIESILIVDIETTHWMPLPEPPNSI
jgi:hypothetical protein